MISSIPLTPPETEGRPTGVACVPTAGADYGCEIGAEFLRHGGQRRNRAL